MFVSVSAADEKGQGKKSREEFSFMTNNEEIGRDNSNVSNEFWLDLRSTSIPLHEALLVMKSEGIDVDNLVNGVLIPSEGEDDSGNYVTIVPLESSMAEERSDFMKSFAFNLRYKNDNSLVDPIPALDHLNIGKWVVADCTEVESDDQRHEHIVGLASLLNAVTSSGVSTATYLLSAKELVQETSEEDATSRKTQSGGLAIICNTQDQIFKAVVLSKTLSCDGSVSESGILLQSESMKCRLRIASVLPFDFALWRMASSLKDAET